MTFSLQNHDSDPIGVQYLFSNISRGAKDVKVRKQYVIEKINIGGQIELNVKSAQNLIISQPLA